jgi:dethiobiotin synthetase
VRRTRRRSAASERGTAPGRRGLHPSGFRPRPAGHRSARALGGAAAAVPLRIFVTATDTGVGKTEVAAALLSLLADAGLRPAPFKPYESGCKRLGAPADALALRRAARSDDPLDRICLHRFKAALAPGVAARRLGRVPDIEPVLEAFRSFGNRPLVVEGAGGLLVPLDPERDVVDLIELLGLPVILVARAGLGTLNHTGLSLRLLAERGIEVRAVVLSRGTPGRDLSVRDNAELLRKRHGVEVFGPVPNVTDPTARRRVLRRILAPLLSPS